MIKILLNNKYMKVHVFVVAALAVLMITYTLLYRLDDDQIEDYAVFFPADTLCYTRQDDIYALKNFVVKSPLFQWYKDIPVEKICNSLQLPDCKQTKQTLESRILDFLDNDLVYELTSQSFAYALLPPKKGKGERVVAAKDSLEEYIKEHSVLISLPRHRAGVFHFFAKVLGKYKDSFSLQIGQYGKHLIYHVKDAENAYYYARINGMLILSQGYGTLGRVLDSYSGNVPSLVAAASYKSIRSNSKKGQTPHYFYVNLASCRHFLLQLAETSENGYKDVLVKELNTTNGFNGVGVQVWEENDILYDKIVASYSQEGVNDIVREYLGNVPVKSSMLNLATPSPTFYYWSNSFNFRHILPYLLKEYSSFDRRRNIDTVFQEKTGLELSHIFNGFADEVSLFFEKNNAHVFLPVPLGLFFVKLKEVERTKKAVDDLVRSSKVPFKTREIEGVTVTYWKKSPQDGIQILYGVLNNYLFIGNSLKLVKRFIADYPLNMDIENGEISGFPQIFREENNSLIYFNNFELLDMFKPVLSMLGTVLVLQDRELARKSRLVIREMVHPLLDALKIFKTTSTRSYFTPEFVIVESQTEIVLPAKTKDS